MIDFAALLYAPIYRAFGVQATFACLYGDRVELTVIDQTSGVEVAEASSIDVKTIRPAVTIRAAYEKTSGVNAAMAYGTDGAVAALGLVTLDDTLSVQAVYAPAPIVREDALKKNPKIAEALAPVFKLLDGPTLQGLNAKIQLEGQDAKKVAGDFLKSKGLLK